MCDFGKVIKACKLHNDILYNGGQFRNDICQPSNAYTSKEEKKAREWEDLRAPWWMSPFWICQWM